VISSLIAICSSIWQAANRRGVPVLPPGSGPAPQTPGAVVIASHDRQMPADLAAWPTLPITDDSKESHPPRGQWC
jgi:hypothetical protein